MLEEPGKPLFVDRRCASSRRKVPCCPSCLHYKECLEAGESVVPSMKRDKAAEAERKRKAFDEWLGL